MRISDLGSGVCSSDVVNNNYIGAYNVGAAFLFFLLAGVLALVMRVQLALPLQGILSQETYNQFFTMHGTIMMFLFAVPAMEALAWFFCPRFWQPGTFPFPGFPVSPFGRFWLG